MTQKYKRQTTWTTNIYGLRNHIRRRDESFAAKNVDK